MSEALRLRLQAESAMWRQRGDAHLCALLDDASAALAQPTAATAQRDIGAQLANVAFNLAQRPGHALTSDDVALLDKLRRQWDAQ